MKRTFLILSLLLISLLSNSQTHLRSGKSDASKTLFDSGGVTLNVREYNFDSCGVTGRQIYKCEFTFKNNNSCSVILKRCDFYTYNVTDSIHRVGCKIAGVSASNKADTIAAGAQMIVNVYGESPGIYQAKGTPVKSGVTYHWEFNDFTHYKK